jgi:hypothetical protein
MLARKSSLLSKALHAKSPVYIIVLVAVVVGAAWANSARAATTSSSDNDAITPALKLAAGTLNLEGSGQAVDAASAATLLPLWQLLAELEASGSAAPEEIIAVVDEIKLNMTSAQLKAIDAMSISQADLGAASGNTSSSTAAKATGTQSASAASDPMFGGDMAGGAPMDGGGPMPSGNSSSTSTVKTSTSASTSAVPAVIRQVIQLLQSKVQS